MANIKVKLASGDVFNIPVVAGSQYRIGTFDVNGSGDYESNKSKTCIKVTTDAGDVVYYDIQRLEYNNSYTYSGGIEKAIEIGGFSNPNTMLSDSAKNALVQSMLQDNLDKLINSILLDGESRNYTEAMPWIIDKNAAGNMDAIKQRYLDAKAEWEKDNTMRKDVAQTRGDSEFRLTTGGIVKTDIQSLKEISAFSCGDFPQEDPLQGPYKYMDVFETASLVTK